VRGTPTRGARLFVDKCSTCHAIGAKRVGPDLASVPQLDDPIAIMAAMWNHSALMDQELRKRGLAWPLLEPGDAADLTAFILTSRAQPAVPPIAK
jgi:mono/diheme cytochrome c family protein